MYVFDADVLGNGVSFDPQVRSRIGEGIGPTRLYAHSTARNPQSTYTPEYSLAPSFSIR